MRLTKPPRLPLADAAVAAAADAADAAAPCGGGGGDGGGGGTHHEDGKQGTPEQAYPLPATASYRGRLLPRTTLATEWTAIFSHAVQLLPPQ